MYTLNGQTRMETALSPSGAPQLPSVIPYEDICIRDHWTAITNCAWWAPYDPDERIQRVWRTDVLSAIPQDWYCLDAHPPVDSLRTVRIEQRADSVWRVDQSGNQVQLIPPSVSGERELRSTLTVSPPCPASREAVDRLFASSPQPTEPHVGQTPQPPRYGALQDLYADRLPYARINAPLWDCFALWGCERTLMMVHEDSSLLAYACERYLERALRTVPQLTAAGARLIWIEDCMTDSISPAAYRTLNLPALQTLTRAIEAHGLYSVHYATGRLTDRWDLVLSSGATALALEESRKGFVHDIVEIARRVDGQMALFGNLDACHDLERASIDDLQVAVARQQEAALYNRRRFVMSLGSPVTPGTPIERLHLWRRLAQAN